MVEGSCLGGVLEGVSCFLRGSALLAKCLEVISLEVRYPGVFAPTFGLFKVLIGKVPLLVSFIRKSGRREAGG